MFSLTGPGKENWQGCLPFALSCDFTAVAAFEFEAEAKTGAEVEVEVEVETEAVSALFSA